jgi:hypothetical protein
MVQSWEQYMYLHSFIAYCIEYKLFAVSSHIPRPTKLVAPPKPLPMPVEPVPRGSANSSRELESLKDELSQTKSALASSQKEVELLAQLVAQLKERYISARVELALHGSTGAKPEGHT